MSQRRWWLLLVVFCVCVSPAFGQTVTIEWVHNYSGQPLSQAYEFSPVRLRATDGGSAGLGSLSVRVTSDLRGDEEWITLWEDANNPGVFISSFYGLYVHGTLTTDPPAQDGLFQVTENAGPPLQRDTIRAFFESCSAPPCPTDAVPMIGSTIRLADSAWVDVDNAVPGGSLYIEVKDYGAPYWAPATATVVSQSGDSEIVSLPPDFSDPENTLNVFRQSIDVELGPAVPGDGVLQVQDLDTITASHPDPLGLSSSTDSAVVDTIPIRFLDRFGNPADYQFEDSPVRVRAVHPDGNTDPGAADAVTATLLTKDIEGNTRDTETLQLTETGPDTGVFTGQIQHMAYYQAYPGNGWLESWHTYSGPGDPSFSDLVTAILDSESTTVPFLFSKVWFIDAAGNEATQYNLGGRIYMRVEREWTNNSPVQADFLQVEVRSLTTGDFEYKTLHETGPDTAVFEGWIDSAELPAAWDNVLAVQAGETIEMISHGYLIQVKDQAVIIINQPPVAGDDTASLAEDTSVSIPVLANDSDPENAPLHLDGIHTAPAHGTAAMEPSGSILYTPAQNYYGTDSFQYRVHDGIDSVVGTVTITISPVNDPTVAVDDFVTTPEDLTVTFNALANDTDADGDALTISSYFPGACGNVMLNPDNTFTYTPEPNCYTPPGTPGYIMYWVSDGTSQDIGHVHLTVTPVNDPPVAMDDSATTAEDTAVTVDVLANDSDIDGDALSVTAVTQGSNGAVTFNAGSVTYTPNANFNGTDSFSYTISDGNGGTVTAAVSITIDAANDNPVAANDSAGTNEDTAVAINVLNNDSDPEGHTLSITAVTQGSNGSVTFNAGSVTYTPNANFNGSDSFSYTISDGNGGTATATVSITVNAGNDSPTATNDSKTTTEDTATTIDVLANDSDPDGDTLSITAVTQGSNGSVTFNASSVTYTPNADFNGSDSFTYSISDGNGGTAMATVSITIDAANDNPVATNDAASTNEDAAVAINVLNNDSDPEGHTLSITAVTQGSKGSVTFTASSVTYTPAANANGSDSFTYTISDGNGGTATATVVITVNAVNDSPTAANDSKTTAEDTAATIDVLANDSDPDGDTLSITAVTQGSHGGVTFTASSVTYTPNANFNGSDSFSYTISDGNGGNATATVSITVNAVNDSPTAANDSKTTAEDTATTISVLANDSDIDGDTLSITAVTQGTKGSVTFTAGSVTYTPAANANGSDSFTYTVGDGHGGSATATVAITISAVNDAPDAVNDAAGTNEDTAVIISVLANDADVDGEAVILTGVTQGTRGSVVQNGNGTVTYTPNPNTFGADAFTYTVRDAAGLTDTATVAVNVAPVNDPPDAINDSAVANEGSNVVITVLANDTDLEGPLTVTAASAPAHGTATINGNGTITYTPAPNYTGSDSFTYTISDGAATDTATVSVQVKDVIGNVAVLGTHSVWIQSGADVLSGDVVANEAGSAPFLSSTEVTIGGGGASTAAGWDVQGNRVTVLSGGSVASDVHDNQLSGGGSISGAQYTPLSLPVFATLPAFQSASPGSTDVNVANNGSLTLAAGSYRDLIIGRKATVTFTGGTYHFRSIQVDREAKLFFSAASGIRVQQKMSTGILVTIGPGSGSSATAASIVFYVAGINGTTGTLAATPKAVEVGSSNVVSANIYAPNGTLWLKDQAQAMGSFLGRDVNIGGNGQVSLMSAW